MKRFLAILTIASLPISIAAGEKGRFGGGMRLEVQYQDGCPIEILEKKSAVTDKKNASPWARAFLGKTSDDYLHEATGASPDDLIYTVAFKNAGQRRIEAVEFLWEAFNAFADPLGERSYSYRVELESGKARSRYDAGPAISDDVALYRLSVRRVKFSDGGDWPAAPPASP